MEGETVSELPTVGSWVKFRRFGWLPDWLSWIPGYWVWYKVGGHFKQDTERVHSGESANRSTWHTRPIDSIEVAAAVTLAAGTYRWDGKTFTRIEE